MRYDYTSEIEAVAASAWQQTEPRFSLPVRLPDDLDDEEWPEDEPEAVETATPEHHRKPLIYVAFNLPLPPIGLFRAFGYWDWRRSFIAGLEREANRFYAATLLQYLRDMKPPFTLDVFCWVPQALHTEQESYITRLVTPLVADTLRLPQVNAPATAHFEFRIPPPSVRCGICVEVREVA